MGPTDDIMADGRGLGGAAPTDAVWCDCFMTMMFACNGREKNVMIQIGP